MEVNNYTSIRENAFSPDGQLFWIMLNPDHPISNAKWHLAIGNLADRKLIDTCLDYPWSVQFSPDGKYLVLLNYDRHQQELRIFDLEHWKLYRTGIYHTGEIIGWRAE